MPAAADTATAQAGATEQLATPARARKLAPSACARFGVRRQSAAQLARRLDKRHDISADVPGRSVAGPNPLGAGAATHAASAPGARPFRRTRTLALALLAVALPLAHPQSAHAHAQLRQTIPQTGAVVPREPSRFVFGFDQAVQGGLGAVRVFDSAGRRVDDGVVSHPGDRASLIAVGLRPGLPDGSYIATYRVVSLDTHIVSGGAVFSIGHAGGPGRETVAGLLAKSRTARATLIAFGAVRALDYVAIGVSVGGLLFLALVWGPASAGLAAPARHALLARARPVLALAAGVGALANALGFPLQGAEQAGVSFWAAIDGNVLREVLHTRFGTWWGIRLLDFLALLALVAPQTSRLARRTWCRAATGAAAGLLVVTVALSGHAYSQSPRGLLIALDLLHVGAMCLWLGGLAMLLLAVPRATAALAPEGRSALLDDLLRRFSPLALASVLALAGSGVVQSYVHVRSLSALLETGYGHDVLAKTALLAALVGLGYTQRARVLPLVHRAAQKQESPGASGFLLRRVLRVELLLVLAVLGVTAALVDFAPPVEQTSGPVSISTRVGPAQLEMTVEPARPGLNGIHIYLFDARSGSPYGAAREVALQASLPGRAIGPVAVKLERAGPGHYVGVGAELVPAGEWRLRLTVRVSEFEQFSRELKVPIG